MKLAAEAEIEPGSFGCEEFQRLVLKQCPDLAYCRIVTNDAKHLGSDRYPGDPSFRTGVAPAEITFTNSNGEPISFVNIEGRPLTFTSEAWDLMIVMDDRTRHRAAEVFGRALIWWTEFIYSNHIDEFQEPLREADLPPTGDL